MIYRDADHPLLDTWGEDYDAWGGYLVDLQVLSETHYLTPSFYLF